MFFPPNIEYIRRKLIIKTGRTVINRETQRRVKERD
jgi:hypothetical protein